MKRPTTAAIQRFIWERFVLKDPFGPFIPGTETARLSNELMQNFSGIYCGTVPDKYMEKIFEVRSAKTGKCFARVRVK